MGKDGSRSFSQSLNHGAATNGFALVTGASSGIGKALATVLATRGFNLIVVARRANLLQELKQDLERTYAIEVLSFPADITNDKDIRKLTEFIQSFSKPLTILINNAGIGCFGYFSSSSRSVQQKLIDVNISAMVRLSHICIPVLEKQRNSYILNVGSITSFMPGPLMSVYFASKSFVLSYTEAIDEELRIQKSSLRASVLCPGPTGSEFHSNRDFLQFDNKVVQRRVKTKQADDVAEYAIRKLFAGKRVIVHGLLNKLIIFCFRFLPRSLVSKIVGISQQRIQKIYGCAS